MRGGAAMETTAALLVGLIVITLGATFADPGDTQPDPRTSSYVNDPDGARALHEVLRACGLRTERLLEPASALPDTDRTLLVMAPSEPIIEAHEEALFDWVERGGRLVIAAAVPRPPVRPSFHGPLLARLGLVARPRGMVARSVTVVPGAGMDTGTAAVWPARQVLDDLPEGAKRDPRSGAARTLITTRSQRLAVAVPFGTAGGEVIVLADETMLSNRHLREAENAVVIVQLLTARERDGGRVVFDEYHHGFRPEGEREGLYTQAAGLLVTTWPGRAVLLVLAAWLVMLSGRVLRLGAPLPDAPPPRRRLSEHADALGQLLEKARAREEALRVLAAGARRVVGPRAGLPTSLSAMSFRDRLAASPAPGAKDLAGALDDAERLQPTRDADLARTARRLAETRRHYLHGDVHRGS